MSRILVEIRVPAAEARYDVFIPDESRLSEVTELLKVLFSDESEGSFSPTADTVLCDAVTGSVLDFNRSAQELGLKNGSRLLLV